jgi:hypothetical protein
MLKSKQIRLPLQEFFYLKVLSIYEFLAFQYLSRIKIAAVTTADVKRATKTISAERAEGEQYNCSLSKV